jgi:hypothetical protein
LASDEDASTRYDVANHPSATPETLTLLARDGNEIIRQSVAKHPSTPLEVVTSLARAEGPSGRGLLAAVQTAQKKLAAWLAKEFPIGSCIEAKDHRFIHSQCARGRILRHYMDAYGNPNIEAQDAAGDLFSVNPFRTDMQIVPDEENVNPS